MRSNTAWIIGLGILLSVSTTVRGEENCAKELLISRLDWAQFEVVQGRLAVRGSRYVRRKTLSNEQSEGRREVLGFGVEGAIPLVRYELSDPREELLVCFNADGVTLRHRERTDSQTDSQTDSAIREVTFEQPAKGPIRLEIASASAPRQTLTAESLWHLLMLHEESCRTHLVPLLTRIWPDWPAIHDVEHIQEALVRLARDDWRPDETQWSEWVRQLGSPRFHERQAADRHLRAAGQAVLPFLDSLDAGRLDTEQRLRVRRIRQALRLRQSDQPRRVAMWLYRDPATWVALLSHESPTYRQVAVGQLKRLSGQPIDFDPHAAPERRARQIQELSHRLVSD